MAIYELKLSLFPFGSVVSRNKDEVFEWKNSFHEMKDFEGHSAETWKEIFEEVNSQPYASLQPMQKEKANLKINLHCGMQFLQEGRESYQLPITPDFDITLFPESVPDFNTLQDELSRKPSFENLYRLTSWNGPLPFSSYISQELRDKVLQFDIAPYEEFARGEISRLNKLLSKLRSNSSLRANDLPSDRKQARAIDTIFTPSQN